MTCGDVVRPMGAGADDDTDPRTKGEEAQGSFFYGVEEGGRGARGGEGDGEEG